MNQRLISEYVVFGHVGRLEQQVTLEQQVNLDYQDEFNILWMSLRLISDYVAFGL